MTNGSLMKVKSIAECPPWNEGQKYCRMLPLDILQYFRPSLSANWSWKPIFGLLKDTCL